MKKALIIILLFIIVQSIFGQIYSDKKLLYQNFGVWRYNIDNNSQVAIHGYVTKQEILRTNNHKLQEKTIPSLPQYRYELKMISKSTHYNDTTSAWLYGVRIYIDNVEMTKDQFPNGFIVSVKTKPTLIYWYETPNDSVNFEVSWDNSIHEPRLIK